MTKEEMTEQGLNQYLLPEKQRECGSFALVSRGVEILCLEKARFDNLLDSATNRKLEALQRTYPRCAWEPPCVNWLLILTMSALACMMLVALLYCIFQMCRRRSPKVILERSESDNGAEEYQHHSWRSVVQRLVALLEQDDSPDLKQQRQRHPLPIPKGNTAAVSKLLLEKANDSQQDNRPDQLLRLEGMDSALNKSRQDSTQSRVRILRALYEQAGSPVQKQQPSLPEVPVARGNSAAVLKLLLEKASPNTPNTPEMHWRRRSLQQAPAQPVVMAQTDPDVDKSKAKDAGISHDSQSPGGNASDSGSAPPLAASTLPPTRLTMDDFVLHKVLGSGHFGKVLLAELKGHGEYFAMKAVKKVKVARGLVKYAMVEKKVLTLAEENPFLTHLYCSFQTKEHLFFVMEYISGRDLLFHLKIKGCFDLKSATFYAAEIVVGLQFLHSKGIIHRDLKLGNVMLDRDGHIKIIDFGVCSIGTGRASTYVGTKLYMAPEILERRYSYSFSVDWWSFGVLVCKMLTDRYPLNAEHVEDCYLFCEDDMEESKDLVEELLSQDPNHRLGVMGNIRAHPFFKKMEWDALEKREVTPPFKPHMKVPEYCSNSLRKNQKEKPLLSHGDKDNLESLDQAVFAGFSFITSKMEVMLDKGEC